MNVSGDIPNLQGRRVTLRPLRKEDFTQWQEVRIKNHDWLAKWEPRRSSGQKDPVQDRGTFETRCRSRQRESQLGTGWGFGIFVDDCFIGEINLNNVTRGAFQSSHVGYWVGADQAGKGYTPESLVLLMRFAFEKLGLHRLQVSIVPRNLPSRRVVEKLNLRCEGLSEKYLEIAGTWEDHLRFAITSEEWVRRSDGLIKKWVQN
ncbi:MAG TPA: GNAT family protein [Acidimicrobiales bacterium]|nr:GNAT family protein [Acidimicrobiales bacterium]|tara:strand:- start:3143 stop:3754 length:612 start_codon:yes stop_codon:yes gene_type:complete